MSKRFFLAAFIIGTVFAQHTSAQTPKPSGTFNPFQSAFIDPALNENAPTFFTTPSPLLSSLKVSQTNSAVPFSALTSVSNVYGIWNNQTSPLQYNDELNTVSLVLRKGNYYVASPANNSGAFVAYTGKNFGTNWDSTCLWSNSTNLGRYPQGGLYNPPGNTTYSLSFAVAMGPVSNNNTWIGNLYAGKSLSVAGTNSPGPDQQLLLSNLSSYPASQARHHFSKNSFVSTDDGVVRSLASILNNPNQANTKPRGAMLVKGTFTNNAFVWSTDSFIPQVMSTSTGDKYLAPDAYQAWNEAGTVGYVMMLGVAANATLSNRSWQPIIYKTTNSGASWAQIQSIDFNDPNNVSILNKLAAVHNYPCLYKPFFNASEGIACVVDANDKLHIVSTIMSGAYDLQDSLTNVYTFTQIGDEYYWPFSPGHVPYIYDFYGDGTAAWNVNVIDSLSSQGPGWKTNEPGYNDNPWDAVVATGDKVPCGARIQAARSADGNHILYCYAVSDTNFTINANKYNSIPNLFTRAWNAMTNKVSEKNILTQGSGGNPNINSRAQLHYLSRSIAAASPSTGAVTFTAPITVANSNPLTQGSNNTVYFSKAVFTFTNYNASPLPMGTPLPTGTVCNVTTVGLQEHALNLGFQLFPNPADNQLQIEISSDKTEAVIISVSNVIGQELITFETAAENGGRIPVSITSLTPGLYFVTVESDGRKCTKRFIKK